jgi:hypothetical protein
MRLLVTKNRSKMLYSVCPETLNFFPRCTSPSNGVAHFSALLLVTTIYSALLGVFKTHNALQGSVVMA